MSFKRVVILLVIVTLSLCSRASAEDAGAKITKLYERKVEILTGLLQQHLNRLGVLSGEDRTTHWNAAIRISGQLCDVRRKLASVKEDELKALYKHQELCEAFLADVKKRALFDATPYDQLSAELCVIDVQLEIALLEK